jgi:hypothetical protein
MWIKNIWINWLNKKKNIRFKYENVLKKLKYYLKNKNINLKNDIKENW